MGKETDLDSLALLASLFAYGEMKAEKYQYEYDDEIYKDEEAVKYRTRLSRCIISLA